ncbi:transferrin-binding protein-like solute binding protein [Psychrobacter okhotskensis]|uniref:transferrin-binding protein-like solute binding protein n=1 Tax=Psychrobacter okhotskensis TaxID=212403 RepID=UPI0015642752|nr:transferrin-binding protein-like solute binding protein [Psychrobacter okhotskensis]NRD71466.1 transferrin-binding protein-like solute binding protein [Psychrobacter okhotskensis]
MSPNRHSISAVSTAKKFKTPLKASVVLLTSMILAACNTTDDPSYNLDDVFTPMPGNGGATDQELEEAKAEAEKAKAEAEKAKAEAEKAKAEAAEQIAAAEKAAAEKAEAAIKAKEEAEAAAAAAEKAQADAIKAKEEAEKALEEALANGGGSEALQKEADRKAKLAEEAQTAAEAAQAAAEAAQEAATAEAAAAQAAQKAAQDAATAAEIKNAPEATKSGVQSLNVNVAPLSKVFKTTTRDFDADENSVVARADLASESAPGAGDGVLGALTITTSGDGDTAVAGSNGFKAHDDSTVVAALGQELPLNYTSTYKDFGDDMRIGHIDGTANFSGVELPVNGVAVIGNATKAENMPTEGTVGYTGDATYRELGIGNDLEFGSSVFTADFVAKNLKGDLTFSDKTIGLEAAIDGNQFSGSKDGYNAEGGFFGGDAQYVGGVYEGKGAQGTYGATSDKQAAAEQAAKDTKAAADKAQAAIAAAQAAAEKAQADAEKAQAAAVKAKADAEKAQEAADNAGTGGNDEALQEALDRAEAAEAAAEKAQADADAAIKAATEKAQEKIKAAQDQAQVEIAAAQSNVEAAQKEAATAKAAAATAEAAALAAEKDAAEKIAAAESAAKEDVATAKAAADKAKADAAKAQAAQQKAEEEAQDAEDRAAEAEAARTAAEKKAQDLQDELDAINNPDAYKSDVEAEQSGVQHLSVDASALQQGVKTTTTRDFAIRSTSDVDARADLALEGLLPGPIAIQVSGDNDTDTENGFKAHEGTGNVLGEGDLAYTATYKDFGDGAMRIAHIDGSVNAGAIPVDGVAVVGNKTATLPTEGTFEYAGDATNRKVGVDNTVEYGSSEFTADFVASKVDGTLKFAEAGEIGLSADIDGNEFSGATADDTGYNTEGAFYGKDANFIGGIYEGNGSQGTFGAEKDGTPADLVVPTEPLPEPPVNPDAAVDAEFTGFQSNTLSSKKTNFTEDAIGYAEIRDDKSDFTETETVDGSKVPVDNREGNNFTSYDSFLARADMTKPDSVKEAVNVNLSAAGDAAYNNSEDFKLHTESTNVQGPVALDLNYSSVYKNFDSQMQIGHVYGDPNQSFLGDLARVSTVYVQGNSTNLDDMKYMKDLAQYNIDNNINDGMVAYTGVATYMENLHLKDGARGGPVVDGSSKFDVDFVNSKLEGTLTFAEGDYKYMPAGNEININADITGNTFAGNANNIDTAGGFYGEDAQFLGGVYQEALERGGKGAQPGEGTTFQGTFGAEKQ